MGRFALVAPRHTDYLRIWGCALPKAQQSQIGAGEREITWTSRAVIKYVCVQQHIKTWDGNAEYLGSLCFGVELFERVTNPGGHINE